MLWKCVKQPAAKRFFPLPNEIFSLGLSPGALAVYSYLLYCEDRKTYQCYPSYTSIGKSVNMSVNTVRKYVAELEEQGLVVTEPTSIMTKERRSGSVVPLRQGIQSLSMLWGNCFRSGDESAKRCRGTNAPVN